MVEKKVIQNKLDARQKLASLSDKELITLARDPEEFDKFIEGYALSINYLYVCYAYRYDDIIRKMINENMERLDGNEELTNNVYRILRIFDRHSKVSCADKIDFYNEYEAVERTSLGLSNFELSLEDFEKCAANYFEKIVEGKLDEIKNNPMYLATINYIAKYHSKYVAFMASEIKENLTNIDRNAFEDEKDYKKFRRAAKRTMKKVTRAVQKVKEESAKSLKK